MNNIERRGFISSLFAGLASIPFVGKLFASEPNHFGEQHNEKCMELVGEVGEVIRGSGPDGKNCFSGEWISVNDRLPEMKEYPLSFSPGKISFSSKVLAVREKGSIQIVMLQQQPGGSPKFLVCESGRALMQEIKVLYWCEMPNTPVKLIQGTRIGDENITDITEVIQ